MNNGVKTRTHCRSRSNRYRYHKIDVIGQYHTGRLLCSENYTGDTDETRISTGNSETDENPATDLQQSAGTSSVLVKFVGAAADVAKHKLEQMNINADVIDLRYIV